jgi:hypothetical protein
VDGWSDKNDGEGRLESVIPFSTLYSPTYQDKKLRKQNIKLGSIIDSRYLSLSLVLNALYVTFLVVSPATSLLLWIPSKLRDQQTNDNPFVRYATLMAANLTPRPYQHWQSSK